MLLLKYYKLTINKMSKIIKKLKKIIAKIRNDLELAKTDQATRNYIERK